MMANLVASLVAAEAIVTTEAKAKALRPIAEKLITKAKKAPTPRRGSLHRIREIQSYLGDKEMTDKLVDEVAPRYAERPGGYTRILKLGPRHGDNAPMARIELVWTVRSGAVECSGVHASLSDGASWAESRLDGVRLVVAYDGTGFHGFAENAGVATVGAHACGRRIERVLRHRPSS